MAATAGSVNAAIWKKSTVRICVSGKRAMSGPKLDMDVNSLRKTSNVAVQGASAHTTTTQNLQVRHGPCFVCLCRIASNCSCMHFNGRNVGSSKV